MKKINAFVVTLISSLCLPVVTYAQDLDSSFRNLGGSINSFRDNIVTSLITLFATMAMAAFFFGLVQYIWGVREGDKTKISNGNKFMVAGLGALFVMFSIWGIIFFFQKTLGIDGKNTIIIPQVQIGGSPNTAPSSPLGGSPTQTPQQYRCPDGRIVVVSNENDGPVVCSTYNGQQNSPSSQNSSNGASVNTANGIDCGAINDAETCTTMSCSWSNAERSCSI